MSGGVDSAVAAALLVEAGHDCIGVTLRLVPEHPEKPPFEPCCGLEAVADARRVCKALGIPHETMHAVDRFNTAIIDPFIQEYRRGRTPNPCILCNRFIKFAALCERADAVGAAFVAMGHYARLERQGERFALRRGSHREKDQSYMLAALTQEQLGRALFPLGGMHKEEVRERARTLDLRTAAKRESQEICFVADRDHAGFIEKRSGPMEPGPILSTGGEILGTHRGLAHYTVGQRRGLGIGAARPLYVLRLDMGRNALVAGHEEESFCARFTTEPLRWSAMAPSSRAFDGLAQIRYRHEPVPARIEPHKDGARVHLLEPQRAVAPGQWAVFYDTAGCVLAAAIIEDFESLPASPLRTEDAGH